MFGLGKRHHREIEATQLAALVEAGSAIVVDVREADEFAAGHVPGAMNLPLSAFDPAAIPVADGKTVVLNCLGGKRSGMALDQCVAAQAAIDTHLAGGFNAWAQAGLPVES
ncbi:MAG: hypothetical protein RLZZ08_1656 [Pseudomonadota bacterium]|jgi:rhodanese-related sulfurtransferase